MTSHHLEHHAAFVRVARGPQPVDRLGGDVDRGVEAERVVGGVDVVVDRLGDADDVDAVGVETFGRRCGALTADGDDTVDPEVLENLLDGVGATVGSEYGPNRLVPRMVPPWLDRPRTTERSSSMMSP